MKIANDIRAILTQDNWIKGTYAQDRHGNEVSSFSLYACKFCLGGACLSLHEKYSSLERETFYAAIRDHIGKGIAEFNDDPNTTWDDIDQLLKHIETLRD